MKHPKFVMRVFYMIVVILLLSSCNTSNSAFKAYENANTPVLLGKGTLSTDAVQWNNIFIPQTKEFFFTKMGESASVIHKLTYDNGAFENLEEIPLPAGSPHSDVYVNPAGNLMLFSSLMPEHEKDTLSDWNIWKSVKKDGEWQDPTPFFDDNIEGNQFYPWLTNSGNLFFAITPHGSQNSDLYRSEFIDDTYSQPAPLSNLNSDQLEGDAFVAPDESYIIFAGFEREQNLGKSDLYIAFKQKDNWSAPVWLGEDINSEGYDGSPFVTEDGKFLLFTSSRGSTDDAVFFNHYIVAFSEEKWK